MTLKPILKRDKMAINKKVNAIFRLMEIFLERKEISIYDADVLEEFNCSTKTLERYLKDIETSYAHIITIKKGRPKFWKLVRVSDIFEEFVKNSYDLTNLFDLAQNFDPEIFKELEKGTLSKLAKNNESVFLFKNSIMEEIKGEKTKKIFQTLKEAIRNHEYRDITYDYDEVVVHKNVKCIKLLFLGNNWYLMGVDEAERLLFRRLTFIEKIGYSKKSNFNKKEVESYLNFLKTVQNPMTLYGVTPKETIVKATPHVAKYFERGMKPLLPSQHFLEKHEDGSIIFSLSYTQDLEILPFIQKWMPDLIILEPKELKEAYLKKLKETMKHHSI